MLNLNANSASSLEFPGTGICGDSNQCAPFNIRKANRRRHQSLNFIRLERISKSADERGNEQRLLLTPNSSCKSSQQCSVPNRSLLLEGPLSARSAALFSALPTHSWLHELYPLPLPERGAHKCMPRVHLNVGGAHFEIARTLLSCYPTTRLGRLGLLLEKHERERPPTEEELLELCDDYRLTPSERPASPRVLGTVYEKPDDADEPVHPDIDDDNEDKVFGREAAKQVEQLQVTTSPLIAAPAAWFYFERDSTALPMLLNFYRTGKLHLDDEMCVVNFAEELDYWAINTKQLEPCCARKFSLLRHSIAADLKHDEELLELVDEDKELALFGSSRWERVKKWLFLLLERPNSSILVKVTMGMSILFILLSTATLLIQSVPCLFYDPVHCHKHPKPKNATRISISTTTTTSTTGTPLKRGLDPHYVLEGLEAACVVWFTFEFVARLVASPKKLAFLLSPMNLIDLAAILPFYVALIVTHTLDDIRIPVMRMTTSSTSQASLSSASGNWASSTTARLAFSQKQMAQGEAAAQTITMDKIEEVRRILQILRVLRIFRVLKLARHSTGLQALGYTFSKSYRELCVLALFLFIGVISFAALIHFAEKGEANQKGFKSIPDSFWWAIISMTTVGYGDVYPVTVTGKIVAAACCISGILVIGMPIPFIVNNFAEYYQRQRETEQLKKCFLHEDKVDHSYGKCTAATSNIKPAGRQSAAKEKHSHTDITNPLMNAALSPGKETGPSTEAVFS